MGDRVENEGNQGKKRRLNSKQVHSNDGVGSSTDEAYFCGDDLDVEQDRWQDVSADPQQLRNSDIVPPGPICEDTELKEGGTAWQLEMLMVFLHLAVSMHFGSN